MHLPFNGGMHVNTIKKLVNKTLINKLVLSRTDYSKTAKLVLGSILGALAAIFQSAGIFAGIGYVFSILTTWPIVLATVISIRMGLMTYGLTFFLLAIIQPSELIVFPFTTGLLGISLGIAFRISKSRFLVTLIGGICLATGIMIILYGFRFPVLGPSITSTVKGNVILGILGFSLVYSWIWMWLSIIGIKVLNKAKVTKIFY